MSDVISTYEYTLPQQAQLAAGIPFILNIIAYVGKAAMAVYLFILLVKFLRRGIKLLDIYISEKTKQN